MAQTTGEFLKINIRVMKLWGFWTPKNKIMSIIYNVYTGLMFIMFVVTIPTAALLYFATKDSIIVTEITESAYLLAELTAYVFRMMVWIGNEKLIKQTIYMMKDPIFNKQTAEQNIYLETAGSNAEKLYQAYQGACTGALFAWASVPFFSDKRILPLEVWYPLDTQESTTAYVFVYIHVFISVAACTIINVATDTMVSGLMLYATRQLKVLKSTFNQISQYSVNLYKEYNSINLTEQLNELDNKIYKRITECIQHHEAIVKFVDNIESSFNMFVFVQFMAGSCIICTTAFELSIISPLHFKFYWMLSYLICMLMELLLYCWFGTELHYESISLTDAVYMSDWYKYGPKSKKALFIFMERSKRPLRVRAAKLFDLSLETFTKILRGAYSLFAVLQHLLHTNSSLQHTIKDLS